MDLCERGPASRCRGWLRPHRCRWRALLGFNLFGQGFRLAFYLQRALQSGAVPISLQKHRYPPVRVRDSFITYMQRKNERKAPGNAGCATREGVSIINGLSSTLFTETRGKAIKCTSSIISNLSLERAAALTTLRLSWESMVTFPRHHSHVVHIHGRRGGLGRLMLRWVS